MSKAQGKFDFSVHHPFKYIYFLGRHSLINEWEALLCVVVSVDIVAGHHR